MEKFVTSPRMLASAGHDRYGLLLAKHFADDPDTSIAMLNLKPDITSGVEAVAWRTVENGKEKLVASHGS